MVASESPSSRTVSLADGQTLGSAVPVLGHLWIVLASLELAADLASLVGSQDWPCSGSYAVPSCRCSVATLGSALPLWSTLEGLGRVAWSCRRLVSGSNKLFHALGQSRAHWSSEGKWAGSELGVRSGMYATEGSQVCR